MGDLINLRRARKAKARNAASAAAAENRARFGATLQNKQLIEARKRAEDSVLDGAKLSTRLEAVKPRE